MNGCIGSMICITEDKEMGMILPIILYALDIIEYYIGNKYFFEGRMRRLWLVPIAGIALLILLSVLAPIGSGINIFEASGIMVEA